MPCSSRAMMKAAPISLSAWANPGADDGECGDGEERPNGRHYLRHSRAVPADQVSPAQPLKFWQT